MKFVKMILQKCEFNIALRTNHFSKSDLHALQSVREEKRVGGYLEMRFACLSVATQVNDIPNNLIQDTGSFATTH